MAWIRTVPEGQEGPELAPVYDGIRAVADSGRVAHVMQAQSLHPRALELHYGFYREVMFGPSPLSRAQREMIALAVSATNGCAYCAAHHAERLMAELHDEGLVRQLARDYREADLAARDRALLDYAVALTCEPDERTAEEIERLREYGFADEAVLHAAEVAAYYNMANRLALGLGVELEPGHPRW